MIRVNGPASHPYDLDAGHVALSDWYHDGVDSLWNAVQMTTTVGAPPIPNNLINGLNLFRDPRANRTTGSRWQTSFQPAKSYRLRFVNTAIDTHYRVALDGHAMTVIAADFVPIHPYTTAVLSIAIGQRYDVVIEAGQQTEGDWWLRSVSQHRSCGSAQLDPDNMRAIIRYDPSSTADPSSLPLPLRPGSGSDGHLSANHDHHSCDDEPLASLVPCLEMAAGEKDLVEHLTLGLSSADGHFRWTLDNNTFLSEWRYPSTYPRPDLACI